MSFRFGGKQLALSFGSYPTTGLAVVRRSAYCDVNLYIAKADLHAKAYGSFVPDFGHLRFCPNTLFAVLDWS